MKITFKYIFLLSLSFLFVNQVTAQELTEEQKEAFSIQAQKKISLLTFYISGITNRTIAEETRNKYIRLAVGLFDSNAFIEVTQNNGKRKIKVPSKQYFEERIKSNYEQKFEYVIVEYDTKAYYISDFVKDPNNPNEYIATASFVQTFKAKVKGDSGHEFIDIDPKKVKVILRFKKDFAGKRWILLLGNVTIQTDQA